MTDLAQELPFVPVIIIGAGRSGTNALRNAMTTLPQLRTWPCDEINAIWRHGNIAFPDDEMTASEAKPNVRKFIRSAFCSFWRSAGQPHYVVEKTCANSLRVEFVHAVLPEARFIHIVREGSDVISSAALRWQGRLEVPGLAYYRTKLRYVPLPDLPFYGWAFLRNRLHLVFSKAKRYSIWGPRFRGMTANSSEPIEEVCALQWHHCVTKAEAALQKLPEGQAITIRYEDFTSDPASTLATILSFLGTNASENDIASAVSDVRRSSTGKGAPVLTRLKPQTRVQIEANNRYFGYGLQTDARSKSFDPPST